MIYLKNICKRYKSSHGEIEALRDINFHAEKGEFVVLKGPSGSGKTTWLLITGGILRPNSGTVSMNDKDIYSLKENKRTSLRASEIGFVFQLFYLVPYMNVLENILLSAGLPANQGNKKKAMDLADSLGLAGRLMHKPAELSAGECQRVALARALIHHPGLLLADEPTGNLDPENSKEAIKIIKHYHQQGGTVLLVTHTDIADPFADRVIHLENGKILK